MYNNPEYGLLKIIYLTVFLVYLSYIYIYFISVVINGEVKIELLYLMGLVENGVQQCYLVLL